MDWLSRVERDQLRRVVERSVLDFENSLGYEEFLRAMSVGGIKAAGCKAECMDGLDRGEIEKDVLDDFGRKVEEGGSLRV